MSKIVFYELSPKLKIAIETCRKFRGFEAEFWARKSAILDPIWTQKQKVKYLKIFVIWRKCMGIEPSLQSCNIPKYLNIFGAIFCHCAVFVHIFIFTTVDKG
jgi:hypothetical protein